MEIILLIFVVALAYFGWVLYSSNKRDAEQSNDSVPYKVESPVSPMPEPQPVPVVETAPVAVEGAGVVAASATKPKKQQFAKKPAAKKATPAKAPAKAPAKKPAAMKSKKS